MDSVAVFALFVFMVTLLCFCVLSFFRRIKVYIYIIRRSCVRSTTFARRLCDTTSAIEYVEMQISTLVRRFVLIFLRYLLHVNCLSHRRPPTRSAFDNDECHMTAFRPISEAAHSWSYDK